uniref:protein kinase domain-containing protein n=1 Tax=Gemmatimonas sp. TaxID=1962908 RepID=UPI00286E2CF3
VDGTVFYVMPFVEGETLRDRLVREKQLPIAEAVRIARETASALDYAHRRGVVHRDIKPENILLQDGRVIVADFGIALAANKADRGSRMTETGMSLGTPHYMSPEQAMGERELDGRSDIYALGCVLYEMLAGEPPFTGATTQAIVARVLTVPPAPLTQTRSTVPPHVEQAVMVAVQKLPDDRFTTASAFADALSDAGSLSVASRPQHANTARVRSWRAAAAFVGVIAIAAMAWWAGRSGSGPTVREWSSFTQLTDASGVESSPSITPDGESFAYSSNARGTYDIQVQRVGGRNPVLVAGDTTRDELSPAYSPDGKQIAYALGEGGIFVVGATGESPRRLTSIGTNPTWSPDGRQVAFSTEVSTTPYQTLGTGRIGIVDVASGQTRMLQMADSNQQALQPAWSPSGARIAFWTVKGGRRDLVTVRADGSALVEVTSDDAVDWSPEWAADGRSLYFASDRGGTMGVWRITVDEESGRPSGAPEFVIAGVDVAMSMPRLSRDGNTLIFRSSIESVNPARIDFDATTGRAGATTLLQRRTAVLSPFDVSPDGKWLALVNAPDRQQDLFLMRTNGSELTRVTDDAARDWNPRFTPDGSALTFHSNSRGVYDGWSVRLDGSGRTQLTAIPSEIVYPVFAPDGKRLLVSSLTNNMTWIGTAPWPMTPGNSTPLVVPTTPIGRMDNTRWSPDGRFIAGGIVSPAGNYKGNAVFDVATGTTRVLSDDADGPEMAFLPGSRSVVYFTQAGRLVMQDIETLRRRVILDSLPYPADVMRSIVAAPDGRALYYGAYQTEANIWVVRRSGAERK